MRVVLLLLVMACQNPEVSVVDATPPPVPTVPATPEAIAHAHWVIVADASKVYTPARRIDAENRVKVAGNVKVLSALDSMAHQTATIEGIRSASQIARDGQTSLHDAPLETLLGDAGDMVLHGLVATACNDHGDVAATKALLAALREMPLPRKTDSHGMIFQAENERAAFDQEMKIALGEKAFAAISKDAPPPKKNIP